MSLSCVSSTPLLTVQNLVKYFPVRRRGIFFYKEIGQIKAVDGVHLTIRKGETFGLVGESGCGKTTTARVILGLIPPTAGEEWFEGKPVFSLLQTAHKSEILALRRKMQLVFQDPYLSLNPRLTVAATLTEAFKIHRHLPESEWNDRVYALLEMVGLERAHARRYPHEFSGGQRQRIGIARALAVEPDFLVCDEPVSSLDVSVRAQILNLLAELQERLQLTYLYISHDLSSVRYISDRVGVMYLGKLVEVAPVHELFTHPLHPYTQALLSSIPIPNPRLSQQRTLLRGEVPSPINPPAGCRFHPRCPVAEAICKREIPPLLAVAEEHQVACHLVHDSSSTQLREQP
ncbi:MAG: ABC transporter ATP-binding protein [Nitrospinota bacterium]|nr:MAG: ABC transporter ATP-binding protein [Nitrospinota bacterium]